MGNPYWFRDLTSKVTRRVKKLIGRPDPTPWVVRPPAPAPGGPVTITGLLADAPFVRAMHEACSPRNVAVHVVPDAQALSIQVAGLTLGPIDRAVAVAKLRTAGIELVPNATGPRPGDRAFVRAYSLFGDQTLLWTSRELKRYEPLTWADARTNNLTPAFNLIDRVRRTIGLEFFAIDLGLADGRLTIVGFAEDVSWTDTAPLFPWFCERIAERACRPNTPDNGHGVWLPANPAAAATSAANPSPAVLQALINAA